MIAPLTANFDPNHTTDVAIDTNLIINFNRDVTFGMGNIYIYEIGGTLVATIDVNSGLVAISGANAIVDPLNPLAYSTNYYITIDSGAVKDLYNNNYTGVGDWTVWNFTTEAAPVVPPPPETPTPTPIPLTVTPPTETETPTETVTPTETPTQTITPSETIPTETQSIAAPIIETGAWAWWYTLIIIVALLLLFLFLLFFWRRKKKEKEA